ncbi:carboxypeptidase Y-deficient [Saitoella coloradoensis]
MVPRFYEELERMQTVRNLAYNHDPPASEALRLRKRLVDAFAQYDAISKRIRNLPAESLAQEKLQIAIHQMATQFMTVHLVPLQSVQRSAGTPSTTSQEGAAVNEVQNTLSEDAETKLREQLMVLEEQRFLVQGMVEDAKRQRQLDEVATLTKSLEELDLEARSTARKLAEGGIVII